ncbi:MAG: hypothetical protein IKI02_03160 [Oscillospiraceae bacterium]|nr:hypothetical protein [Oscillospiraceae bacterium]
MPSSASEGSDITQAIYDRLGSFSDDYDNEALIRTGKRTYSFENTMYGTLGPERVVWDEDTYEAMQQSIRKNQKNQGKKNRK